MQPDQKKEWLDSKATRKALRISACELSHLREAGTLSFQKRGNAYVYSRHDVAATLRQMPRTKPA